MFICIPMSDSVENETRVIEMTADWFSGTLG